VLLVPLELQLGGEIDELAVDPGASEALAGQLVEEGVGEWMELPLWIVDPHFAGMMQADNSRAVAACRVSVPSTIRQSALA